MKRKYYIRGLGFGILMTTLVFTFLNASEVSDEEVIKRARELGYVLPDETTPTIDLDELLAQDTPKPTDTVAPTDKPTLTPTSAITPEPTPTDSPTLTPTQTPTPSPTQLPTSTPTPTPTQTPTPTPQTVRTKINVVRGSSASQVCVLLQEAGIVSDWTGFHKYLAERKLVDYINVGTFELSDDMTYQEIAYILTGR